MESELVLQTNIFFYITSAAVIVVTLLLLVALYFVIRILRNVRDITDTVKEGADSLTTGIKEMRRTVVEGGAKILPIASILMKAADHFTEHKKTRKSKRKKKVDEDDE